MHCVSVRRFQTKPVLILKRSVLYRNGTPKYLNLTSEATRCRIKAISYLHVSFGTPANLLLWRQENWCARRGLDLSTSLQQFKGRRNFSGAAI